MTTERADRHLTDARTKHLQAARDKYSLRTIAPAGQEALLEAVMSIAERLSGEPDPDEEEHRAAERARDGEIQDRRRRLRRRSRRSCGNSSATAWRSSTRSARQRIRRATPPLVAGVS